MPLQSFTDVDIHLRELAKLESHLTTEEARMNEQINKIKEAFDAKTSSDRAQKSLLESEIESFCTSQKKEFDKNRTKKLAFGEVYFRMTTPKVNQLNRKFTVKTTIEFLKKLYKNKYIRTKEEIDKERILEDYTAEKIDDSKIAAVGLRIDQEDRFGYKIDWEKFNEEAA